MTQSQTFLAELKHEAIATRSLLALVPMANADYKPHAKSMSLGRLATHVAEIPGWLKETLMQEVLDFSKGDFKPNVLTTNVQLLELFDKHLVQADTLLNTFEDEKLAELWTMRAGEHIIFTQPKGIVVRNWCLNHLYHHRAQLGVYLRMLDIPLPSTYGPTADVN